MKIPSLGKELRPPGPIGVYEVLLLSVLSKNFESHLLFPYSELLLRKMPLVEQGITSKKNLNQ